MFTNYYKDKQLDNKFDVGFRGGKYELVKDHERSDNKTPKRILGYSK